MKIRQAELKDFSELYFIGLNTPELKVSATEEFMDEDEFRFCLTNPHGLFLLAEEQGKIIGFIYANAKDVERDYALKWACLVYLVTIPECRHQGIASQLYEECIKELKNRNISNIYAWAKQNSTIVNFLQKKGLNPGKEYLWMDKKL